GPRALFPGPRAVPSGDCATAFCGVLALPYHLQATSDASPITELSNSNVLSSSGARSRLPRSLNFAQLPISARDKPAHGPAKRRLIAHSPLTNSRPRPDTQAAHACARSHAETPPP